MSNKLTIQAVKNVIWRTDCKELVLDGLTCSLPVMSREQNKIVDNFIVMSKEQLSDEIYVYAVFGIYSENAETAYKKLVQKNMPVQRTYLANTDETRMIGYNGYADSYVKVRELMRKTKGSYTHDECAFIQSFVDNFRIAIGESAWQLYQILVKDFFVWLDNNKIQYK